MISEQTTQKSRVQILRDEVKIRVATGEGAGAMIAEILAENGIELPGVDWSVPFPNWLIATVDMEVIGCCQIAISKPIGYGEFLYVKKSVPFKLRAIAIRKLIIQAMATLHVAGCTYVGGFVSVENFKFNGVLERLGFVKAYTADLIMKRVA